VVRLRAAQQGSHVVIEVCDDGAGIGVERVRAKAVERGMISAERATHQSERELQQWLFVPGFSTASTVTNVSGRGVGMDVVRTNVEKIGGKVELESRPGKGTTLRLRIPLTLETRRALLETLHHYVESDGAYCWVQASRWRIRRYGVGWWRGGRFITGRRPGGNSKEWLVDRVVGWLRRSLFRISSSCHLFFPCQQAFDLSVEAVCDGGFSCFGGEAKGLSDADLDIPGAEPATARHL
jgi:hypothetical protein